MAPVQLCHGVQIRHHRPSGGMQLPGPGSYEIEGFAGLAIGNQSCRCDGRRGQDVAEGRLEEPVLDKCLTALPYT